MRTSHLPVEICEAILDFVHRLPGFATSSPISTRDFHLQQRTLSACALVCKSWTPHAQYLLWHDVFLDSESSVSAFLATVHAAPDRWTPLLSSLFLYTDVGSLMTGLFLQPFPNLRLLCAKAVDWRVHPRLFRMRLPFFASLEELQLEECQFGTLRVLLDLVWACRNLVHLVLQDCHVHKENAHADVNLGRACLQTRGCPKLTSLFVYGYPFVLDSLLPGDAFGSAVTSLDITYMYFTDAQTLPRFLRGSFPALRDLYVAVDEFNIGRSSTNPNPSFVHAIAHALTTPALRSLAVTMTYKEVVQHNCCAALIGEPEDADGPGPSLRSLLPGLETLQIYNGAGRLCVAYINAALPSMVGVLVTNRVSGRSTVAQDPVSVPGASAIQAVPEILV